MKIKPSDAFEAIGFLFLAAAFDLWFGLAAALAVCGVGCIVFGLAAGDAAVNIRVPRRKRTQ